MENKTKHNPELRNAITWLKAKRIITTQQEIADAIEVNKKTMSKLVNGLQKLDLALKTKINAAFDIDLDDHKKLKVISKEDSVEEVDLTTYMSFMITNIRAMGEWMKEADLKMGELQKEMKTIRKKLAS